MSDAHVSQIAPVLIIFFNRPDNLKQLLAVLSRADVSDLYFASDGPRDENDAILINAGWDLIKKTYPNLPLGRMLMREHNLGCRAAVSSAISWFFSKVEFGIIIEDDCIPNEEFFEVLTSGLLKHSSNLDVFSINATNPFGNHKRLATPYLSIYPQIWGWASWANRWSLYKLDFLDGDEIVRSMISRSLRTQNFIKRWKFRSIWSRILDLAGRGKIDTWDYSMLASMWRNQKYSIQLTGNYVKNIGFSQSATHTTIKPFWAPEKYWRGKDRHNETLEPNENLDSWLTSKVYRCTFVSMAKNLAKDLMNSIGLRS
jgi:hypothetical protein